MPDSTTDQQAIRLIMTNRAGRPTTIELPAGWRSGGSALPRVVADSPSKPLAPPSPQPMQVRQPAAAVHLVWSFLLRAAGSTATWAKQGDTAEAESRLRELRAFLIEDPKHLDTFFDTLPDQSERVADFLVRLQQFAFGEPAEPEDCMEELEGFYSAGVELERFLIDVGWRLSDLTVGLPLLPKFAIRTVENLVTTARLIGLPLTIYAASRGFEETIACTLEISKHAENSSVAAAALQSLQRLQQVRRRPELLAAVRDTRELARIVPKVFTEATSAIGKVPGYRESTTKFLKGIRDNWKSESTEQKAEPQKADSTPPQPPPPPPAPSAGEPVVAPGEIRRVDLQSSAAPREAAAKPDPEPLPGVTPAVPKSQGSHKPPDETKQ